MECINRCPFCGSHEVETAEEDIRSIAVFCLGCYCRGPLKETEELAIHFWNRPYVDQLSASTESSL